MSKQRRSTDQARHTPATRLRPALFLMIAFGAGLLSTLLSTSSGCSHSTPDVHDAADATNDPSGGGSSAEGGSAPDASADAGADADADADADGDPDADNDASTYVEGAGPDAQCTKVVIDMGDWSTMASVINQRTNTTGPGATSVKDAVGTWAYLDKAVEDSMQVFPINGAPYLRSTIRDGESWHSSTYDRTEVTVTGYKFAAGQKYILQWTGLIPQSLPTSGTVTFLMQLHESNDESPAYEVTLHDGKLVFVDSGARPDGASYGGPSFELGTVNDMIDVPITLRLTYIPSSTNGYLKFEMNGQVITERTGKTTKTPGQDYAKFGTLYDWGNVLVSPDSDAGRSYSVYTQTAWACEVP